MYAVVCYDVPAKRTPRYHKLLGRYLLWVQNSVFAGDVTEVQYLDLQRQVSRLRQKTDHVLWITTENRRNVRVEQWESGSQVANTDHLGSAVT